MKRLNQLLPPKGPLAQKQGKQKRGESVEEVNLNDFKSRSNEFTPSEITWNQWLAGIIDGNGYLALQTPNNVAVCEITMPLEDESLLFKIKQKLGGSMKSRSGAKAVRYRLCHKKGMEDLLLRINGSIRNTIRVIQFKKLCEKFNIIYLKAKPLTLSNGYMAGFFDADGSIFIGVSKTSPEHSILSGVGGKIIRLQNSQGHNQLRIEISNKYRENLLFFQEVFGSGSIRAVTHRKKYLNHIYQIHHIGLFLNYISKYPLHSVKMKRVLKVRSYFELKRIKAHLADQSSMKGRAWNAFCKKWYKV